ncbi:uncharacterized protein BX663DRAFT_507407 [Cokeromyces recurvatus]|uniref:uncharacterized protein n=1 Tax=Cokeromyces recurvatus TaxID=90255 RepID=UPI002220B8A1|nr:uncharacterized protein BX663DRAFT_507407 [Cokeromyces recurvatus]KAI7903734.1 hypothetical protein BX663DRAFT_507407 [Cokeromyces recurvatus]
MSHLVLLTLGSRGDLQPLVALAIEYKKKISQHRLTIVAPIELHYVYQHLYDLHNIHSYSILQQAKSNKERIVERKQLWEACQILKPTKLVYTTFVLEGWSIAEKLKIPSVVVSFFSLDLYPIPDEFEAEIIKSFPKLYDSQLRSIWYPHIHHWMWRLFLEDMGDFREFILNLDPIPTCFDNIPPFIYAIDPDLFYGNREGATMGGFWSLMTKEKEINSNDNRSQQKPILLIHFGSMDTLSPILCNIDQCSIFLDEIQQRILEILAYNNNLFDIIWIISSQDTILYKLVKAKFTTGYNSRLRIISPAIDHAAFIQSHNVFGIIHHGGMNTCFTMIQLGIPQAIIPFMFDQHAWARKLTSIGLSKSISVNHSWVIVIDWMLLSLNNHIQHHWQNKVIQNTEKGFHDTIKILSNLS